MTQNASCGKHVVNLEIASRDAQTLNLSPNVSRNTDMLFDILQDNLSKIGYQLTKSSSFRVGNIVKNRAQYIVNKTRNTSNGSIRKAMRSAFWCKVALYPDEILHGPSEIMSELKKREEELMRENEKLRREAEGKKLK